jgi:hypothetical protein
METKKEMEEYQEAIARDDIREERHHKLVTQNQRAELCGSLPTGWKVKYPCILPDGHAGNHEDQFHCWWR